MPAQRIPIIGYPLSDDLVERALTRALTEAGHDLVLERWERRPHQLADALAELRASDAYAGALIASPHKEKAPPLSDWLSDDARASGAVTLYVRADARLRGYNTDADGVRAGLAEILPRAEAKWPRNAVILGAGGAARAAVAVLIGSGFQHVAVFNRHLHKAEALVADFARTARHMELRARPWHEAIIEAELARGELIVNASGIGSEGLESPIPVELVPSGRHLLDLALSPGSTPLIDAVVANDGTATNGHAAFAASVAAMVELLTGSAPAPEAIRAAIAEELGAPTGAEPAPG
jgi:shikimate dehydrogenase